MRSGIYGMSQWDEVLRELASGAWVVNWAGVRGYGGKRYEMRRNHPDSDWPGALLGGLTAPLYHALHDAGMLKPTQIPHLNGYYRGVTYQERIPVHS